jgi:uncharacterized repeat protein (TIGR01451 family)
MLKYCLAVCLVLGTLLLSSHSSFAEGEAPRPNPLSSEPPRFPLYSDQVVISPSVNLESTGRAASIHGDPAHGREVFAARCSVCHGARGTGGIPNVGSEDGTVPPLNPFDNSGFLEEAAGDPATLAASLDRFIQHGSRPGGLNPDRSMIPWGDRQLLTQNDIADVESYVMQLNGMYWSDRWAPPAEVQVATSRQGKSVTYEITVVNHSNAQLDHLDLRDTLPKGLTYVSSYFPSAGQSSASWSGNTVEWINLDGVAPGSTLGPFVIVADAASSEVQPNTAALSFTWSSWDGTAYPSTAVSDPASP